MVKEANAKKQELRIEISQLENEVRRLRDQVADKQTENKNLEVLVAKEQSLKSKKGELETRALNKLEADLQN